MSDFEAQSFLARRYMLLCVKESVPKNVARWLAEHAPGPQYDGEHAKTTPKPNGFVSTMMPGAGCVAIS